MTSELLRGESLDISVSSIFWYVLHLIRAIRASDKTGHRHCFLKAKEVTLLELKFASIFGTGYKESDPEKLHPESSNEVMELLDSVMLNCAKCCLCSREVESGAYFLTVTQVRFQFTYCV